jgi:hypothetical protein
LGLRCGAYRGGGRRRRGRVAATFRLMSVLPPTPNVIEIQTSARLPCPFLALEPTSSNACESRR